ncbi:MAG: hypothetical protein JKY56_03150, partial [Kofleriaceae bacterium]|nr:hypothetical protein [Kofleriaceae bacterium]
MANRLYVGNLSYTTTADDLREAFGGGGREVTDVFVVTDRETGRPRGFAFVEMGNSADATNAVSEMNGATIDGRQLKVNEAAERVERDNKRGGDRDNNGGGDRPSRGYDRGGERDGDRPSRGYDRGGERGADRPSRGYDRGGGNQRPTRGYGSDRSDSDKGS